MWTYADPTKYVLIHGYATVIEAEVALAVPDLNFTAQGRATATVAAIIGAEVNGYGADRGRPAASWLRFPGSASSWQAGGLLTRH